MTLDTATLSTARPTTRVSLGPPGLVFWLFVGFAILAGLDTNSRQSFTEFLWVAPLWLAIAGWWLLRFGWWVYAVGSRSRSRTWLAWLLVPAAMGIVFLLVRQNVPYNVRLSLSRPAMDQAAAEIIAGGSTDRAWIGLYPTDVVERVPGGMRFAVEGSGFLSRWGFAYAVDGDPAAGEFDPLWCCDSYEPIGGGWFRWFQEWD